MGQDTNSGLPAVGDRALGDTLAMIALEAGGEILDVYGTDFAVEQKDNDSPVTEADRRAEAIILKRLAEIAPEVPVIAEEAASAGDIPETGARFFLVDPLDGTREFVNRRDEFTVNIALVENGEPVAGVVYAPALGMMAVADGPASGRTVMLGKGEPIASAAWQPIHTREVPAAGLIAVASRSHRDAETDAFLESHDVKETRSAGSSLKFCLIARGEADVYPRFGRTMEWDTAAGHAVLRAAGGCVLTAEGEPLRYAKRERGYDNPAFIAWGRKPV
ncbi:3'(2'),5'-bisphosphate nucleotidase CysQ [Microbaculum sp. FT89]|uniref:3'(2'),5'-bisphosphate nucleotidase CysQ n=1 Tax=Microbaculum sp. FT89 TaxID=3447298 RepID=UPI003F531056